MGIQTIRRNIHCNREINPTRLFKEAIEFEQNESYTILKQCQFMDEIESYIKKIYLKYSEEEYLAYDISDSTIECSESEDNGELFGRYLEPAKIK